MSPLSTDALFAALDPDTADLDHLHARLTEQADATGDLDVAYRTLDSAVGPLLLAATDAGLVRVVYEVEGFDAALDALARRVSPRILRAPARLDAASRALEAYLAGTSRDLDVPLDLRLSSGFRAQVLAGLRRIPYGATASYAEIAAAAGNAKAVRATGTACATNPLPIVIPCHRVVRSDGSLGAYLAGPEVKARLLALEGAPAHRR